MSKWGVVLLLGLAGCAANDAYRDGRQLIDQGRMEEGLGRLERGVKANPNDAMLRSYYTHTRAVYLNRLLYDAEKARLLGHNEEAISGFEHALKFSPGEARAQSGLAVAQADQVRRIAVKQAQALYEAGEADQALEKLKALLRENPSQREAQALQRRIEEARLKDTAVVPQLNAFYKKPVTLEFRDAPLKSVFEVLSRTSGINFVFDRDVRADLRATIYVRDTTMEDAINFLLVTNQLEMKVLNDNTILVYPNLPNKARDYQELVVKSFYLGNADVKQTLNLIKTVVKTRDVFIDERLNLLVMRDTPRAIRLAEKLIAAQDLAEPEVLLEIEIMEIARSKLENLGLRYPTQLSAGVQGAAGAGQLTLAEWLNRNSNMVNLKVTDPALVLNLQSQDGDANLLANPRVRVKNREKAKIHIGDRLPVITTTSTANVGVSESVQYLDVGLKLDIEPNIYLDDQVGIKVALEVSNVIKEVTSTQGTLTYQVGTRNTATVLRVANGETQVLAGLISDADRRTSDKVPGLANLPLLGRLFTNNSDNRAKTEIVMLITPYVVHNLDRPAPSALELSSGTEGNFGAGALQLPSAGSPAANPSPSRSQPIPVQPPGVQAPRTNGESVATARPVVQTVLLSAPSQVQVERDFTVIVSFPPGVAGNVQLELLYDATKLQAVGAEGTPGRAQLAIAGTQAVHFRALKGQSGVAQVSVGNIFSIGSGGESVPIAAPGAVVVNITP